MDTVTLLFEKTDHKHVAMDAALHAFIRSVSYVDMHLEPGPQLVGLVQASFPVEGAAIFDADVKATYQAGEWNYDPEHFVRNVYTFETVSDDVEHGLARRVLRVGTFPVGALLMRGAVREATADSIATLCALTFDRYHSYANVGRTETERRTEQLRTTVLEQSCACIQDPAHGDPGCQRWFDRDGRFSSGQCDLVDLIREQASLLNGLTTRLLKTARLEAQDVLLRPEQVSASQIIDDALSILSRTAI